MRALAVLAVLAGLAGPSLAQTGTQTETAVLRPEARPVPQAPLRPVARPPAEGDAQDEGPGLTAVLMASVDTRALAPALRPQTRPQTAAPARPVLPPSADPRPQTLAVVPDPPDPAGAPQERLAEARMDPPVLRLLPDWTADLPPSRPPAEATRPPPPVAAPSLRPALRPERPLAAVAVAPEVPDEALDPAPGPDPDGTGAAPSFPGYSEWAVAAALRPPTRPARIVQAAVRLSEDRARGAICGSADIQGDVLGAVDGPGACGVDGAVRVRSVAGVRLSTPATMDCRTAEALLRWVRTGAIPAVGNAGGGLASIRVASHYACRGRNNQAGARLSEHAFGRAIDIAGFGLRNGGEFTVLNGWGSGTHGARLRRMHQAACGPFSTVLGPEANRFHRDHFHFDTALHRSGSYCR